MFLRYIMWLASMYASKEVVSSESKFKLRILMYVTHVT